MSSDSEEELEERRYCCLKRCSGVCTEPVAKRTRSSLRQLNDIIEQEESSNEPTILDILNEDCWRVLFGYIDAEQLILSERVSRYWRILVQRYLQGVTISLRSSRYQHSVTRKGISKVRELTVPPRYYLGVVERFGKAIVAADCIDAAGLKSLGRHCPDLENLRILEPRFHQVRNLVVRFSKLQRVSFRDVIHLRDDYVSKFLQVNTPKELIISNNVRISGICLTSLQTNLQSLGIHACQNADIICMLLASNRLAHLKELRMNGNSALILSEVFLLIEKTPKLKYLSLEWYMLWEDVDVGDLVDAICQLKELRHLSFHDNDSVKDEWLEPIGRCCTQLRVLDLGGCRDVTPAGIDALCRGAAETLAVLDVSGNRNITNEDVVRWIYLCPKLEILDLHFCTTLTRELVSKCCQAVLTRPKVLRIRLFGTKLRVRQNGSIDYSSEDKEVLETYSNLILDFSTIKLNYQAPRFY